MAKIIEWYRWSNKHELIKSQYGNCQYIDYLNKERDRILKENPERIVEIRKTNSKVSLWLNDIRKINHSKKVKELLFT